MKKDYLIWMLMILPLLKASGQPENLSFNAEAETGYMSSGKMPFWLRSNQFGSIPLDGPSISLLGSARKDYDPAHHGIFDWGASFEGRLNVGNKVNFTLVEGYGKIKLSIFELMAGRSKDITGLCDTTLSSGSWAVSGNALGIPKVEISMPDFYTIPWFGEVLAFKGQIMHGWIGEVTKYRYQGFNGYYDEDTVQINSFIHQKSLYGRFGKPSWKFKIYGGLNHQVIWGGEKRYYTDDFALSHLNTYLYVITGKAYSNGAIQRMRLGNQLGSVDIGFEYTFKKLNILVYRQNLYETGALANFANIQDGLNGISLENKSSNDHIFKWEKLLFEFLYTINQAGRPDSRPTLSAYEGYYNHGEYLEGWSYDEVGIGNPFISTRAYIRDSLPTWPSQHFINNRVSVFHVGMVGSIEKWNIIIKASLSNNYGTYYTTDEEQSTDLDGYGTLGVFGRQDQFSAYLDCSRPLKNGYRVGGTFALDIGELYYNSFGLLLRVSKGF